MKTYDIHYWAQARYLVHAPSDLLWTNSIEDAMGFLRTELQIWESNTNGT